MSADLRSQIASLLAADAPASPAAAPAAAPAGGGLDYDQLAAALIRAGGGRPQGALAAQQAQPTTLTSLLGGVQRAPNRYPASDAGSPAAPSYVITEDTPLWQLSAEDRCHLIKTKGPAWYNATMRAQLKGTRVKLR